MRYFMEPDNEEYRPRMIIWQLNSSVREPADAPDLSTHECLLVLEGIARTAKPIVVLTGGDIIQRRDLLDIVQYGSALGLKIIVEARAEYLSEEILTKFSSCGPKTFRILIENAVQEGRESRFEPTLEFRALEEKVRLMKSAGYEVHLSVTVDTPNVRQLAVNHDYAFRNGADWFYCHLSFEGLPDDSAEPSEQGDPIGGYIEAIAAVKQFSPDHMYFSPQCVKYGYKEFTDSFGTAYEQEGGASVSEWRHWCLGGKTFAFISPTGLVQICAGIGIPCGDLRQKGYDFKQIWEHSEVFQKVRDQVGSCSTTRKALVAEVNNEKK